MRFHYPSSFLKLLLIGFAFAILPLLWAFINANIAFDRLAKQSEITINNAVETTRAGRVLQEQLRLMERSIRQFYVLQDDVLFENYSQASNKFNVAAMQLEQLTKNSMQQQNLKTLYAQTQYLNQAILGTKSDIKNTSNTDANNKTSSTLELGFLDNFNTLSQQIELIIAENNRTIDSTSSQLQLNAEKTQKNLFLQSLVLVPLALLVAGTITFLLARPIRRMDSAIRDLGEGFYSKPIAIDGPGDLRVLGRRLDWLRSELNELNEQKQQFLRHVSHELKTPLTAIREATELLHDGIGGTLTAQQTEITHILRDNSLRLQKMIENLLNHTKIQSIEPKLNLQPTHLPVVIHRVISGHALSIRNKNLNVETDIHVDKIVADEEKLTIIIDNLISNAVKFTPNLGHIKVSAALVKPNTSLIKIGALQGNKWLMIEVVNDGLGLAKEDQEKLFDPFYRGDTVHKSLINGSGLGLTIAKDLVEAHGGNIQLAPSPIGAHFIVRLPLLALNT